MDMNRIFRLNMRIGRAYSRKEDVEEAIGAFSKAIEISPDNPDGYEQRGEAFMLKYRYSNNPEDIDLAVQDFRKALDLLTDVVSKVL